MVGVLYGLACVPLTRPLVRAVRGDLKIGLSWLALPAAFVVLQEAGKIFFGLTEQWKDGRHSSNYNSPLSFLQMLGLVENEVASAVAATEDTVYLSLRFAEKGCFLGPEGVKRGVFRGPL